MRYEYPMWPKNSSRVTGLHFGTGNYVHVDSLEWKSKPTWKDYLELMMNGGFPTVVASVEAHLKVKKRKRKRKAA